MRETSGKFIKTVETIRVHWVDTLLIMLIITHMIYFAAEFQDLQYQMLREIKQHNKQQHFLINCTCIITVDFQGGSFCTVVFVSQHE